MSQPHSNANTLIPSSDQVRLRIELGHVRLSREEVADLGPGSFVLLNTATADLVDIYAGDRLVARGEVVVINDQLCVRIKQISKSRSLTAAA